MGIGADRRIGGKIPQQRQPCRKLSRSRIRIAHADRLGHIRHERPVSLSRQLEIVLQRYPSALVAVIRRLYLSKNSLHVHRMLHVLCYELRQIIFLRFDVDSKFETCRVDPSDMQIGDIPHQPDRHSRVELCQRSIIRTLQPIEPPLPMARIVVIRIQPFVHAVLQQRNDRRCLRSRLVAVQPQRCIARCVVCMLKMQPVVGEIRPRKRVELSRRCDLAQTIRDGLRHRCRWRRRSLCIDLCRSFRLCLTCALRGRLRFTARTRWSKKQQREDCASAERESMCRNVHGPLNYACAKAVYKNQHVPAFYPANNDSA